MSGDATVTLIGDAKAEALIRALKNSKQRAQELSAQFKLSRSEGRWLARQLDKTGAASKRMDRGFAGLSSSLARFVPGLSQASMATGELTGALGAGGAGMAAAALPIAATTVAVVGFAAATVAAANAMSEYVDKIENVSAVTGLHTDTLVALDFASQAAGLSLDQVTNGLAAFTKRAGDAVHIGGEVGEGFERLGVTVDDGTGNLRDMDDVLRDVLVGLQRMPTASERAAAAGAVFGQRGAKIAAIFSDGTATLDEWTDKVREAGVAIDGDMRKGSEEMDRALAEMNLQLKATALTIGSQFAPSVAEGVQVLAKLVDAALDAYSAVSPFVRLMNELTPVTWIYRAAVAALGIETEATADSTTELDTELARLTATAGEAEAALGDAGLGGIYADLRKAKSRLAAATSGESRAQLKATAVLADAEAQSLKNIEAQNLSSAQRQIALEERGQMLGQLEDVLTAEVALADEQDRRRRGVRDLAKLDRENAAALRDQSTARAELQRVLVSQLEGQDAVVANYEIEAQRIRDLASTAVQGEADQQLVRALRSQEVQALATLEQDLIIELADMEDEQHHNRLKQQKEIDDVKKRSAAAQRAQARQQMRDAIAIGTAALSIGQDVVGLVYDRMTAEDDLTNRQKRAALAMFNVGKGIGITQSVINTAQAITKALAQGGPVFGPPMAAAMGLAGGIQVAKIASQKPPSLYEGGLMPDQRHVIAEAGEGVLTRQGVAAVGGEHGLAAVNSGQGAAGSTTLELRYKHIRRAVDLDRRDAANRPGPMRDIRRDGRRGGHSGLRTRKFYGDL